MAKTIKSPAIDKMFDAVLSLENREECYQFFEDLCTIKELLSLSQRYEVASMLDAKKTYAEIQEQTSASTATIGRVNRALSYGNDGYNLVLERMKQNND